MSRRLVWTIAGASALVLALCRQPKVLALDDGAWARQLYRELRDQAVSQKQCAKDRLPAQLTISKHDPTINAAAMLDQQGRPQIVVNQGLLEFNALTALFAVQPDRSKQFRAFDVVIAKAQRPSDKLLPGDGWPDWRRERRPWAWEVFFRSRTAFDLAHEMAHHCLGHRRGTLTEEEQFSFIDDNGATQSWNPAVLLGSLGGASVSPEAASKDLEAAADVWAAELIEIAHEDLRLTTVEGTISAVAELGLLDAVKGRSSVATRSGLTWAHPVGHDRFNRTCQQFSVAGEPLPYVDLVEKLILCLERDDKPLEHLIQLVKERSTICKTQVAITAAAFMSRMPSPLRFEKRKPVDVEIALRGWSEAVPLMARATTSDGLLRMSHDKNASGIAMVACVGEGCGGGRDSPQWRTEIDSGEKYRLEFKNAREGEHFVIYVNGSPVASGTFGPEGTPKFFFPPQGVVSQHGAAIELSVPGVEARPKKGAVTGGRK